MIIRGRRVVTPEGTRPASLLIEEGRIAAVGPYDAPAPGHEELDAADFAVLPGVVDSHVHVNEPGRTEWEGFETATAAAAAGGVTAIVDMPLNSSPVTTTLDALRVKQAAAQGRLKVDCGFWAGLVPGNAREIEPLLDAGVSGFKAFLIDSGIDEFPPVGEAELRAALPVLARRNAPLIAHAELACAAAGAGGDPRAYGTFLASRPKAWENEAVELLIRLCRETRARVHVVHLSSDEAIAPLRRAKAEGLPITAETCPHYLSFAAEDIREGATRFKCCPPIREKANQDRLWAALAEGVIDCVVSDHSPCPPELKGEGAGDFMKAWGGISGLELLLPATWSGARERGFGLDDLARWLCAEPARLAGWSARKGRIAPGCDADLVLFDPDARFTVQGGLLSHRHKVTPYEGASLRGAVKRTYLRGELIYDEKGLVPEAKGRAIFRHERLSAAH